MQPHPPLITCSPRPRGCRLGVQQHVPESRTAFSAPIYIPVGGCALLYEVDVPAGMIGWPVHGLDEFPGIRRMFLENYVRYTFVRYGVPYVVAIECFDGRARFRKMSCRDADKVAVRFLKALRVVGGTPQAQPQATPADAIERPAEESSVLSYHSPGDILPGTGFKRRGGGPGVNPDSQTPFPPPAAPALSLERGFD